MADSQLMQSSTNLFLDLHMHNLSRSSLVWDLRKKEHCGMAMEETRIPRQETAFRSLTLPHMTLIDA